MATKKPSASKPAPAALPAANTPAVDPLADLKAKIAALPPTAQALILKNASGTKLTRPEIGQLRTLRLTTKGDPIKPAAKGDARKPRAMLDHRTVENVLDVAGVDGLAKLHAKYGEALLKPFRKVVKALPEGDDRAALETLIKTWYPRKAGSAGFRAKGYQVVGKVGRVAFEMSRIGAIPGDQVKSEVVTLADGRSGLFVWVAAKGAPASQEAAPSTPAPAAAPPFMAAPASA